LSKPATKPKHSTQDGWGRPITFKAQDFFKKRKSTYRVVVVKEEDGGYSGRCIEYPGAISQGETLAELKKNMREAINLIRQSYEEEIIEHITKETKKNKLIEVSA